MSDPLAKPISAAAAAARHSLESPTLVAVRVLPRPRTREHVIPLLSCPTERSLPEAVCSLGLLRKDYDSTRITKVSASTPSYAIASAPALDCIRAMTASMSATSMSTAT
jgi:hypothetical protein